MSQHSVVTKRSNSGEITSIEIITKHPLEDGHYRTEHDTFGEILVPSKALWGAQTQRSFQNFPIGTNADIMPYHVIEGLAILKKAAATVNAKYSMLSTERAKYIAKAADEIIDGTLQQHFPLVIYQTGSGTQSNMNVNEVIANRCAELSGRKVGDFSFVHPNDHVNRGQSSNDCFPTAMHIAIVRLIHSRLIPSLQYLHDAFEKKQIQFQNIVKIGRTHCQDATPLTVGQEISGFVTMIKNSIERVTSPLSKLYMLAQGGSAVGTGLNTFEGFDVFVAEEIAYLTGYPFITAPNKFEALSTHDAINELSGQLNTVAGSLHKIANDLRLLGSGPRAGLGEYLLPENEPGSSIMPGKVNPTQCEMLTMVCSRVIGNSMQISFAAANGQLQLNVYKPSIIASVLQSIQLLADGCVTFTNKCINDLDINTDHITNLMNRSLMLVTALNPIIGYENAAKVAKTAHALNLTLKQVTVEKLKLLTSDEFDKYVDPSKMISPTPLSVINGSISSSSSNSENQGEFNSK